MTRGAASGGKGKPRKRKVCVVGFQKTGTTSMDVALGRLGYDVGEAWSVINKALRKMDPDDPQVDEVVTRLAVKQLKRHDAIQDSPCPFVFEAFDRAFPGSKFILTTRPVEAWLESVRDYFPDRASPLRRWMYGAETLRGAEDRLAEVYLRQNQRIRDYFADRPADLLELDLGQGGGWYELVEFLGPDMLPPFPKSNARSGRLGPEARAVMKRLWAALP